jgi:hypothetical protein
MAVKFPTISSEKLSADGLAGAAGVSVEEEAAGVSVDEEAAAAGAAAGAGVLGSAAAAAGADAFFGFVTMTTKKSLSLIPVSSIF